MLYFILPIVVLISFAISFLLIKHKDKIALYAHPNHRTMHSSSMPNSGGIAIFISFMIGLSLLNLSIGYDLIISISILFAFGIYDDIYGSTVKGKIFTLFIVGNILYFSGYQLEYLGTYLGYPIELSSLMAYLFLIFIVVGFVNSMNLIDGLDGLVSTIGIVILSSFLYIGIKYNDQFLIYIPAIYIASILGYIYFNWSPAKIFMGDNGSLPLGLIVVLVSIHAINMHYITPISILMLAGLPILDTLIVMTRRVTTGMHPFVADKLHIHHIILKQQKNNTKRTVLILGMIQLLLGYIGLGFKIKDNILILILFILLYIILYFLLTPKRN